MACQCCEMIYALLTGSTPGYMHACMQGPVQSCKTVVVQKGLLNSLNTEKLRRAPCGCAVSHRTPAPALHIQPQALNRSAQSAPLCDPTHAMGPQSSLDSSQLSISKSSVGNLNDGLQMMGLGRPGWPGAHQFCFCTWGPYLVSNNYKHCM